MDTKKYEVFEKTVELSSQTKAAQELGVALPEGRLLVESFARSDGSVILFISEVYISSAWRIASFTAERIRSSSISGKKL